MENFLDFGRHPGQDAAMSHTLSPKTQALSAISSMADEADWEDIFQALYVRKKVQAGLDAAAAGRVVDHETVKKRFRSATRRNPSPTPTR